MGFIVGLVIGVCAMMWYIDVNPKAFPKLCNDETVVSPHIESPTHQ